MRNIIAVDGISKGFRQYKRYPGFGGALKSLFTMAYDEVSAVDDISFSIDSARERAGNPAAVEQWIMLLCTALDWTIELLSPAKNVWPTLADNGRASWPLVGMAPKVPSLGIHTPVVVPTSRTSFQNLHRFGLQPHLRSAISCLVPPVAEQR